MPELRMMDRSNSPSLFDVYAPRSPIPEPTLKLRLVRRDVTTINVFSFVVYLPGRAFARPLRKDTVAGVEVGRPPPIWGLGRASREKFYRLEYHGSGLEVWIEPGPTDVAEGSAEIFFPSIGFLPKVGEFCTVQVRLKTVCIELVLGNRGLMLNEPRTSFAVKGSVTLKAQKHDPVRNSLRS